MEFPLKLQKVEKSVIIDIHSQVVKDLRLEEGDEMLLDIEGATIKIRKRE